MDRVHALFAGQHGVVADSQLRALGISWEQQRTRLRSGEWRRDRPGVIAANASPPTWEQQAMAAVCASAPAGVLAGGAAARLHGLDGFRNFTALSVALPQGASARRLRDTDVLWTRGLTRADRHVVDHVPVTFVPLTLIHLHARGLDAEKALDSALRKQHSALWLRTSFERWHHQRARGAAEMLRLLNDRVGQRLPRSWFQRLAGRLFAEAGLEMVDEWPVRDAAGALLGELDLANVELKLGIECQSVEFHDSATDRYHDLTRRRRLRQLGWEIIEVWWRDLHRMDDVLNDIRAVLGRIR